MASEKWGKFVKALKESLNVSAKTTSSVVKVFSQKTKELAKESKTRFEVFQLQKKYDRLVADLGEIVLGKFKTSKQSVSQSQVDIKEIVLAITEVERSIAVHKARMTQKAESSNEEASEANKKQDAEKKRDRKKPDTSSSDEA